MDAGEEDEEVEAGAGEGAPICSLSLAGVGPNIRNGATSDYSHWFNFT